MQHCVFYDMQWLGDVITCEWWSDIWTQESNAQFYEHRAVGYVEPTWDMVGVIVLSSSGQELDIHLRELNVLINFFLI